MFLHLGASLHGHEYSSPSPTPQAAHNLRSPLRLSTFGAPKSPRVAITPTDGPPAPVAAAAAAAAAAAVPAPVLRHRPMSDYIPRAADYIPRSAVQKLETACEYFAVPAMQQHEDVASESELSDTTMSIDGTLARPARRRRKRRIQRKSTTYFLGYPTPKILGKKKVIQKVLPRLLLQLQKVSEDGRSRPILEIFPSSRIAGPVIAPRLAKRFPGIFGVKRQLGYDDLVLVRRDDDDSVSDGTEADGDEGLESRRLLAVYSPLKHSDEAEIVLDDGSVWVARPLANGSYDFIHVDAEGNTSTARWARRSATTASSAAPADDSVTAATTSTSSSEPRFTFSVINPLSRRHPVMATLTRSSLEVQDTYSSVSSSYGRYPPAIRPGGRPLSMTAVSSQPGCLSGTSSPSHRSSVGSTDGESDCGVMTPVEPEYERTVHNVDDATKMLISVTALWVALRTGWSPNYKPHNDAAGTPLSSPRRSRRNTWSRANAGSETTPVQSESEGPQPGIKKRYSLPVQIPSSSANKSQCAFPSFSGSSTPAVPSSASSTPRPIQRRATSTGAAFMQRHIHLQATSESDEPHEFSTKRRSFSGPPLSNHKTGTVSPPRRPSPVSAMEVVTEVSSKTMKQIPFPDNKKEEGKSIRARLARWVHRLGGGGGEKAR
ncbi:hypothetical protein B0H63DRAFT_206404 [Podospora didyma]|uniref:Uncharacterized protein n=1 Tax=Podospora didyma TaxID=330526 RepID=A0AAE0NH76_9PEZI|nr:hypothetical protein B0H63DRAFT_206404 [Podospora didyma]